MIPLIILVFVAVGASAFAAYAFVIDQRRRAVLGRALGKTDAPAPLAKRAAILIGAPSEPLEQLRRKLGSLVPTTWLDDPATRERLAQAGHDGERPVFLYAITRLTMLVTLPVLAGISEIGSPISDVFLFMVGGFLAAWFIPRGFIDGLVRQRQERIRRAVPDALDLLIVCVEAGSSLESAVLRVSRDLIVVHPDLAYELATVVRKTKAGVPRGEALRGLWTRTGVTELRTLAANIAQSERWGTSVSRVLRVTGETLRRKRRQSAEKRASTATLKMTIPLVTLILPPLFLVILGPSVLQLLQAMRVTPGP